MGRITRLATLLSGSRNPCSRYGLLHQPRLEAPRSVPRHLELHRTLVGQHPLAVVPVTVVARRRLVLQMRVHLHIQCSLGNRLIQIVDQAAATEHFRRVVPSQQLVQQLIANPSSFPCR